MFSSFFRGLVRVPHNALTTPATTTRTVSTLLQKHVNNKYVTKCIPRVQLNQSMHTKPVGLLSPMVLATRSGKGCLALLSNTGTNPLLAASTFKTPSLLGVQARRFLPTLNQVRRQKPRTKRKRSKPVIPANRRILLGPQRKGVCVKNVVRTPRKPNSAQRKCAVLRLNDGRLITAYIPGQKANLQEHGVVLFRGGRVQDCPGLKYKIIRGVYDMN